MAITGSTSKNKTYDTAGLKVPVSLGVIMDGNGRWAKKRLLPRSAGHRAGAENLKELCRNCGNYGVKYLTVYAFSTENWSRPQGEVDQLMKLFVEFFDRYDPELAEEGISARVINMATIKPIDKDILVKAAKETGAIVTAEEHSVIGGLGSAVCEVLAETCPVPVTKVGVQDQYGRSGKVPPLLEMYGLTAKDIVAKAKEAIALKK